MQFKNEHGNCNVPRGDSLGNWVQHQHQEYRKFQEGKPCNGLNVERIGKLNGIGFVWHSHEDSWDDGFVSIHNCHIA